MADRSLAARTDSYFLKTKAIVGRFGDRPATYAVFMRRPVICTPRLALDFLESEAAARGTRFEIELNHAEGAWVGAGAVSGIHRQEGNLGELGAHRIGGVGGDTCGTELLQQHGL